MDPSENSRSNSPAHENENPGSDIVHASGHENVPAENENVQRPQIGNGNEDDERNDSATESEHSAQGSDDEDPIYGWNQDDLAALGYLAKAFRESLNRELKIHGTEIEYKYSLLDGGKYRLFNSNSPQIAQRLMSIMDDHRARQFHIQIERIWFVVVRMLEKWFVAEEVIVVRKWILQKVDLFVNELGIWKRALEYRLSGQPCFDVPSGMIVGTTISSLAECQHISFIHEAIKRVYWLQERQRSGLGLYSGSVKDRYNVRNLTVEAILCSLEPRYSKMFTNFSNIMSWEWWRFLLLVQFSTTIRNYWDDHVVEAIQDYRDYGVHDPSGIPPFDDIVTPSSIHEAEMRGENSCYICAYNYGEEYSDTAQTEPAVRTPCNHVIGRECLRRWVVDEENDTCPSCRTRLYPLYLKLPGPVRDLAGRVTRLKEEALLLDEAIDEFLLAGFQEVHDESFGELLERLNQHSEALAEFVLTNEELKDTLGGYPVGG